MEKYIIDSNADGGIDNKEMKRFQKVLKDINNFSDAEKTELWDNMNKNQELIDGTLIPFQNEAHEIKLSLLN